MSHVRCLLSHVRRTRGDRAHSPRSGGTASTADGCCSGRTDGKDRGREGGTQPDKVTLVPQSSRKIP